MKYTTDASSAESSATSTSAAMMRLDRRGERLAASRSLLARSNAWPTTAAGGVSNSVSDVQPAFPSRVARPRHFGSRAADAKRRARPRGTVISGASSRQPRTPLRRAVAAAGCWRLDCDGANSGRSPSAVGLGAPMMRSRSSGGRGSSGPRSSARSNASARSTPAKSRSRSSGSDRRFQIPGTRTSDISLWVCRLGQLRAAGDV